MISNGIIHIYDMPSSYQIVDAISWSNAEKKTLFEENGFYSWKVTNFEQWLTLEV